VRKHLVHSAAWLLLASGCSTPDQAQVTPGEGPLSGYYPIRIDDPAVVASEVTEVRLGEVRTFGLRELGPNAFEVVVQGAPSSGATSAAISMGPRTKFLPSAFEYLPVPNAHFERMVAVGASLSQGVQNGVPTLHSGLMSPPAQLARQLGGYFPVPLLLEGFLPQITPADIGAPPECQPPDIVAHVTESALEALTILAQGYDAARVDPDIAVHNLAVGGAKIKTVLNAPLEEDFAGSFMARLVLEPYTIGAVERSQLEHAEDRTPSLVVSMDLFGNDAAASLLQGTTIDPTLITPFDDFAADLQEIIDRLANTGAEVFLANIPRVSLLPLTKTKRARMVQAAADAATAAGEDPEVAAAIAANQADAAIQTTDDRGEEMNGLLAELADENPRIHVVDVAARVEEIAADGLIVGDQMLTTQKFGGLLSLDGVHFTDTGYAMLANLFIEAINAELGTNVSSIDLASVMANDPTSPAALAQAGLEVDLCDR
jgi:lysophospholipase L1-like esterase